MLMKISRLLKEKQDNEERGKGHPPQSSPLISPQSITVRSPPPIIEETSLTEPIGVGLPLLQRILMLKAKEETAAKAAKTGVGGQKPLLRSMKSNAIF